MIKDAYLTIAASAEGEFKDRGSKFIGYAFPCNTVEVFEEELLLLKKTHPKSRHHCYAYRMGIEGEQYRANDDGEPSGSAGLPILGQIKSKELFNVAIIVVRYFGGTKLGVPGLINAYKTAAANALAQAEIKEQIVTERYELLFDYGDMGHVMNVLKVLNLEIVEKKFEATASVIINIRKSKVEGELEKLSAKILGISIEEMRLKDVICPVSINLYHA